MISMLRGKIVETGNRHVVLDVGGIGYKVYVTEDTLHKLGAKSDTSLWTHLVVREDALDLYGFIGKKERSVFELLISVSGIGPKSALNILSLINGDALLNAIRTGSTSHLVKVSGIGRKTAEKITLELKDKLGNMDHEDGGVMDAEMSSDADVIEALKALGYEVDEAREALKKIDKTIKDTSAKVKAALRLLN